MPKKPYKMKRGMEEGIPCKPIEIGDTFFASRTHIYDYTLETFGYYLSVNIA
jgi:hypothetical protein